MAGMNWATSVQRLNSALTWEMRKREVLEVNSGWSQVGTWVFPERGNRVFPALVLHGEAALMLGSLIQLILSQVT